MPDPKPPIGLVAFGFWVEIADDNKSAEIFEYAGEDAPNGRADDTPIRRVDGMTVEPERQFNTTWLQARAACLYLRALRDDGTDESETVQHDFTNSPPEAPAAPVAASAPISVASPVSPSAAVPGPSRPSKRKK